MSKYKYPLNTYFYMEVKNISYCISIDMFDDQDEYDDNFKYFVEIFPHEQSKESFESAEFSGTYTFEHDINMNSYPMAWEEKDKTEFRNLVKLSVNNAINEVCENCDTVISEEYPYETLDGKILCEECFIQHLAQEKGLVKE